MEVRSADGIVEYLAETIQAHLDNDEVVLWLVSGGSGIAVSAEVSKQLAGRDLSNLRVTLTDERYVPLGSPDENWQQLLDAGFALPGAQPYRVIQDGLDREQTAAAYEKILEEFVDEADFSIGLLGIGTDGHVAGIKPESPAVGTQQWVAAYQGDDFQRITITPVCIEQLDEAIVYAVGEAKFAVIAALLHELLPTSEQPAQAVKSVARSILFTDYQEDAS